ncbi:hypothetical protein VULLAG_LOCUS15733 [Vulpes lagopus]
MVGSTPSMELSMGPELRT